MSTESAVKGTRGAMTWAQGAGDPTTYLADPKGLPFGPDKARAIEMLAQSLLAAHPAAPTHAGKAADVVPVSATSVTPSPCAS